MTDKHTPGPWIAFDNGVTSDSGAIAKCTPYPEVSNGQTFETCIANARLIALAPFIPELKDALAVLIDHASERYPHFESERGQRELKTARALLSRINTKGGE